SFSSVFVLTLIIFDLDQKYEANIVHIRKPLQLLTWIMAGIIYVAIYTGALVRHTESSLAYGAWPLPFNDLMPHDMHDWVQLSHRILAFIAFITVMIVYIHAIKNYPNIRTIRYGYTASFILIILQVVTGALSVITNVNLIIALLHALFITLLFGMISYFLLLILRSNRGEQ
ncbi:heme A synthase, partial [Staphylococcus equorum]